MPITSLCLAATLCARSAPAQDEVFDRFSFGGYGELHANLLEGSGGDQIDFHRIVWYAGYEFADWIHLRSETELEHAFASSEADGELLLEQFFIDFDVADAWSVRAGRVLSPLGIVNERHEPPTFNGVERPSLETFILPSTWSQDGVGVVGRISSTLDAKLYLASGLDGSAFDAVKGIRDGRLAERPSLSEPALSGRVDWRPLAESTSAADLRLGTSLFHGGLDNGNRGVDPGAPGDLTILSADFEASVARFDVRGVWAVESIDDADMLNEAFGNDVAEELGGWYLEGAAHVMPDAWKHGKLERSDAVVFARYEDFDTQREIPANAAPNPASDRQETTLGFSFFFTENLVFKADWQFRDDARSGDLADQLNFGLGWQY